MQAMKQSVISLLMLISVMSAHCLYNFPHLMLSSFRSYTYVTHSPIEQRVLDCFKSLIAATESASASDVGDCGAGEGDGATQLEAPTLDLSLTLMQLGGDSLAATRFSFLLQESFSLSVSASELLRATLGDIFKLVLMKKGLLTSLPSTRGVYQECN